MDGVLAHEERAIPGADPFVARLRELELPFLVLTNNSIYTPRDLSARLRANGLDVPEEAIWTSALATARFLDEQRPGGSAFAIGEAGLTTALHEAGYTLTDRDPDYVVLGETRTYSFERITRAIRLVLAGARFIATNPDPTGPSPAGPLPATGSVAALISRAAQVDPYFVGKPNPLMMRSALNTLGVHSEATTLIGDRMDTDVVAGLEAGLETILVLTGVTTREEVERFPYRASRVVASLADLVDEGTARFYPQWPANFGSVTASAREMTAAALPWPRFQAPEVIHVVADYGPGDETFVGLARRLALAAPTANVVLTQVPPCDSLAAGFWVACLALGDARGKCLVVHDVAARLARNAQPRECAGWTTDGVAIVGPDTGWSWSFVAPEINGPCYLELPMADRRTYSPDLLAGAIVRAVARHSHAVCEPVPREALPPVPECVVALVDRCGILCTTISRPPAPVGERIGVRIGDASATAVVADDSVEVPRGQLGLGPTSRPWRLRDGEASPFHDLFVPGGSAASYFSSPATGAEIILEHAED